jgi:phenylalanine-4-hydroxylase
VAVRLVVQDKIDAALPVERHLLAAVARQQRVLPARACDEILAGLDLLRLPGDRVAQVAEVAARLHDLGDFGLEPVPALISPGRFFSLLAERKFPVATFIRRREYFDYLQEPDVFHAIYGHCPMLTHRVYADFLQEYGRMALALDKRHLWMAQRLLWLTVEFGLIETAEGVRIYGVGIASSAGESPYTLESEAAERRPFDLLTLLRTPDRTDLYQTVYYVIGSWARLYDVLARGLASVMEQAQVLGPLPAPADVGPSGPRAVAS